MSVTESAEVLAFEPDPVSVAKAALRQRHLRWRDEADAEARQMLAIRLAEIGAEVLRNHRDAPRSPVASLFATIGSEPDVALLASALDADGISMSLPVDHSTGSRLVYRAWRPGDPLTAGPMGIGEPLDRSAEVEPDVLFIPMVAFDRGGRRLGYGAGNVDSTLRALRRRKNILAIGVAFAAQEEPRLPTTPHDEAVDLIITDRDVIDCQG